MRSLVDAVVLLSKGGYVMVPLMLCSVFSVTILIERFFTIRRAQKDASQTVNDAQHAVRCNRMSEAAESLERDDIPLTRVMAAGIKHAHLGEKGVERAMEEQAARETVELTRRFSVLDTIITIAPLLGLLGTCTGMIGAFHVIATRDGISTPTAITGGVAEALIATATGLAIAIFTLIGHNHLQERVKNVLGEIEAAANGVLNAMSDLEEEPGEITRLSA